MTEPNIIDVVHEIARSRKYKDICEATLFRIVKDSLARSRTRKEAVSRAKRKLHQVYGAYLEGWKPKAIREDVACLAGASPEDAKPVCRRILSHHASTRERLPLLDTLYGKIFAIAGIPERILDVGCGLHPFAWPWMGLPEETEYTAWDVNREMVELVQSFFDTVGCRGKAECRDVLVELPEKGFDLVFLMKTLPCLEQQEKGCSQRLLETIPARYSVVSFPVSSLAGRGKGMREAYTGEVERLMRNRPWRAVGLDVREEVVFVVER